MDDFIEVEEIITYVVTCQKCKIRFKADNVDKVARLVAAHLRNAHSGDEERGRV